eukprot:3936327-Rhodomonas_salina.1
MCGTDIGYDATHSVVLRSGMLLPGTKVLEVLEHSLYAALLLPYAISLRTAYNVPGTDIVLCCYQVCNGPCLSHRLRNHLWAAIGIRVRYVMSGTDIQYAAINLRACYPAMSDTGIAYADTRVLFDVRY